MAVPVSTGNKAPTEELGTVLESVMPLAQWSELLDMFEHVPELQFPASINTYDHMRTDAQLGGLYRGTVLPVLKFNWMIDPNGARPEVYRNIAGDLNLPIRGEDPVHIGRRRGRFSWLRHLRDALRAGLYGFYFFEQHGEVRDDGLWHLLKIAPRPSRNISQILIDEHGALRGIKQNTGPLPNVKRMGNRGELVISTPDIPVTQLLAYTWDQEGGNWYGRSMLRDCFRNWVIKDRLMRVDAMSHERHGMGIPHFEAPPGASPELMEALDKMAQAYKVGEKSGGAYPAGAKLRLVGVEGDISNPVASMRFHNEEMSRAWMMMFMQLGQTETGSRALGSEFIDLYMFNEEVIAEWICEVFSEHMIEDWVDWNWGEDEQAPLLVFERQPSEELPTADLIQLIDKKVVEVDDELEAYIRQRFRMPRDFTPRDEREPEPEPPAPPQPPVPPVPAPGEAPPEDQPVPEPGTPAAAGRRRSGARAVGGWVVPLPARTLRRQPYDHEVRAAVDFAEIDANISSAQDQMVNEVSVLQGQQITQLRDLIVDADGNLLTLATLQADPVAHDSILAGMQKAAALGINSAAGEAERQGKENVKKPDASELDKQLASRAAAVDATLARSLSDAASRRALMLTNEGEALTAAQVADKVAAHLHSLTDSYLKDQLGGAATQAMNSGRKIVMDKNDPDEIFASELLDSNTCENCVAVDGTRYTDVISAESDYPTGGYSECKGGPRCRGTLVGLYPESGTGLP